ncbi:pituitary tumor-transforming gene 1 protein-interacting protein-like isoform X1 [Rana temporaria]|uniref:pituitary tumor-transforming gene 1 protein-interacting protein-like isoform X1 n=1 Tax=Rana temporaria TaxID=8407 RepID=UPI001AADD9F4|nr:pituitary tumor-transforming gene 1 protein-interacting protein-like isoform X1 [Rana temporaria]
MEEPSTRIFILLLLSLAAVWGSQTTAPAPQPLTRPCSFYTGRTCEECLKNVTCLWCTTNNTCLDYPVRSIFPPSSLCALSNARWAACWINFQVLIIAMSVVLGVILICFVVCCCYCCYCRKSSSTRLRLEAEEENLIRERERRKQESLQRKNERTIKHNEIRKKYGLLHDTDHPYSKFDD